MAERNNLDVPRIFRVGWQPQEPSALRTSQWDRTYAAETVQTWTRLFRSSELVDYARGTTLIRQGQTAHGIFLLTKGLASLSYALPGDEESLLGVRFPGQVLEYCAHTLEIPYPVSARAVTSVKVLRVSADVYRAMERNNPEVAAFVVRLLLKDLCNAASFITELKGTAPAERFERFLRILASVLGEASKARTIHISIPLRDEEMADILGFSARHLKRVKRDLRLAGRVGFKSPHIVTLSV